MAPLEFDAEFARLFPAHLSSHTLVNSTADRSMTVPLLICEKVHESKGSVFELVLFCFTITATCIE